jgi:hypothetical protein
MIADYALDAALERIASDASRIDITSSRPTNYQAVMQSSLGYTTTFKVTAPRSDGACRACDITNISEGAATRAGTPAYWAVTGKGHLLACGPIKNARAVVPGLPFKLPPLVCELEPAA